MRNGAGVAITLDSTNPGRATFRAGRQRLGLPLFLQRGFCLLPGFEWQQSQPAKQAGWRRQTQTQPNFTNAALAGDYLLGKLPSVGSDHNDATGEFDLL